MTYSIRSAARTDIQRQFRFYPVQQDAPDVAWHWLDAIELAVSTILVIS